MSLRTASNSFLAAAVIGAALFSGAAYARDPVFTAKLSAPVAEQTRVIAQSTVWTCEGDTCLARPSHGLSVRACRQFVREAAAPVTAFGNEARQLTEDEINRCNEYAPQALEARN